ncbi:hypothetical protein BASA60_002891 [Batrachochytrium salamandrivorans]|nr:hypothetical protein BASA60_002891 [Batrachochytrium salamandrivorans]
MVVEIRNDQLEALQNMEKLQIKEQFLETLVDMNHLDINDFSPEMQPQIEKLLKDARSHINSSSSRGLKASKDWTVENFEVDIDYRSCIGEGGFGVIYKAHWRGQEVAVKVVSGSTRQDASDLIEHEASIWYNLNDPNVVKLWRVCLNADNPFIIMPLMACDAAAYIRMNPHTEISVRTHIIQQISSGMKYLHGLSNPIIHGDLKANNVLIGKNGEVAISDFGMALLKRLVDNRSSGRVQISDVRWIAPEKYSKDYVAATPADVFSFGMTSMELLSGEQPFSEETASDIIKERILSGDRPLRPHGIPDSLWKTVDSCWQPDPKSRPSFSAIMGRLSYENIKIIPISSLDSANGGSHVYPDPYGGRLNSTAHIPLQNSPFPTLNSSRVVSSQDVRQMELNGIPPAYSIAHTQYDHGDLQLHGGSQTVQSSHASNLPKILKPPYSASSYTSPTSVNTRGYSDHSSGQGDHHPFQPISLPSVPIYQQNESQNIELSPTGGSFRIFPHKVSLSPHPADYDTISPVTTPLISPASFSSLSLTPNTTHPRTYSYTEIVQPPSAGVLRSSIDSTMRKLSITGMNDIDILLKVFPYWARSHGISHSTFMTISDVVTEDDRPRPIISAGPDGRIYELRILDVSMYSSLSSDLGLLLNLTHLWIERCCLSGTIPVSIGNLTSLTRLDLTGNGLTGPIPATIGQLRQLKHLDMSCNKLSGGIHPAIFSLSQLEFLNLSSNLLGGIVPHEIGQLWALKGLDLEGNRLQGSIPNELSNLKRLQTLDLSNNSLTGVVPASFTTMHALKLVNMDWDRFSSVPHSLLRLRALQ